MPRQADIDAEMAAAMQAMMPSEHHKPLGTFAGDWEMPTPITTRWRSSISTRATTTKSSR
jgi:hypothetical protein